MIGQDKLYTMIEKVLVSSKADQTEAVVLGESSELTRFANSYIHQNVAIDNTRISFRVSVDNRIGIASCNSFVLTDLRRALKAATAIAKRQRPNPDFAGFAEPTRYKVTETFDPKTSKYTPKQRASKLKRVFAKGAKYDYDMAGAFSTGAGEVAVLNSNGVRCYQQYTSASINTIAGGEDSSGYASGISRRVDDLDVLKIADTAVAKCRKSRHPQAVEPGKYEVILEPAAVAELFEWLGFVAFGSKAFEDESSFLAGRIGTKVMGDNITIADDALDPANPGLGFDFEGTPKRRVEMVSNGVARGVVHNLMSARRAGVDSTGHSLLPEEAAEGAVPLNIQMSPGDSTVDDMIGQIEDGLLVTRFHYINGLLDPRNAVMTGMTRDGLLRIKDGKLGGGVKNLRFTDSMLDVFSSVRSLTAGRTAVAAWWGSTGCIYVPAIRVGAFNFSGKTDF